MQHVRYTRKSYSNWSIKSNSGYLKKSPCNFYKYLTLLFIKLNELLFAQKNKCQIIKALTAALINKSENIWWTFKLTNLEYQ